MGVTISCKNHDSIDMGAGGFLRLRRTISDLVGEPWASHYRELTDIPSIHRDGSWYETFDQKTLQLIKGRKIRVKTVDFLLQTDVAGSISPAACKQLLKIIGNYDDDIMYGYCGHPDCARFQDFKRLLQQCVEHNCRLVWY